ncbi:MAG TPA: GntR family transcriptional regulator [Bryobacteraceae bacterium]|nr:GntR family transcriptional regulator [Bryobacteraceae bacterium]
MPKRRLSHEPHVPMYQRILESLAHDIQTGKYRPGQKFPSEATLVRQFGSSRITVGRALNELEHRGLVERRAGSGTYVRTRKTARATFGLLIPDFEATEIFEPICRGIAGAASAKEYAFLWGQTSRQYVEMGVAGVFFAPLEESAEAHALNLEIIAQLEDARIPVVLLDRCYMPYPCRSRHDLVGIDNWRAGFIATEHLVKAGATRIAFLGHARGAQTIDARLSGYRAALGETPALIFRPESIEPRTIEQFHKRSHPDAYVCANDRTAGELMRALISAGQRIPGDVRIVGIDDVEYASLLPVPLTTVRQPCREIGEAALGAMLDRMARPNSLPRDILIECRLVVRESCGSKA